jgi:hypothetical protein
MIGDEHLRSSAARSYSSGRKMLQTLLATGTARAEAQPMQTYEPAVLLRFPARSGPRRHRIQPAVEVTMTQERLESAAR